MAIWAPHPRAALGVGVLLFSVWTYYQLNDPDPWLWAGVYATAALFCALALAGVRPVRLLYGLAAGAVAWALWLGVELVADGAFLFEERGRELFGLLIVAATLVWLARGGGQSGPADQGA